MMLLYAIAPSSERLTSVRNERLQIHDDGQLAVFFEQRSDPPAQTVDEVLAFARTLEQIWAAHTSLLPVRFGTQVDDMGELARTVAEHRDEWQSRLDAVLDRSELIVHLPNASRTTTQRSPAARSGREYMSAVAERVRGQDRAVDELRHLIAPFADEERALSGPAGLRWAFLVRNSHVDAAKAAIREWGRASGSEEVEVTGPWPPFSFCGEVGA